MMVAMAMVSMAAVAQESKDKVAADPKVQPQKEMKSVDMASQKAEWDKKVKDELKLTPEQATKFDALNKEYGDKMNAVQQDASLNQDAQKEKKMTLKKEKEAKLFEIFTPEQQAAYKSLIEKRKKDMEANKPSGN
jgi:Spy/CpxP family protein refolding chaperone